MSHHDVVRGLEPQSLWKHFGEFTHIPRPSGKEEQMAAYVLAWAKERGLQADRDATGNICVRVPATPGREKAPVVVLQGHLDMVCEKDPASPYDPETGNIHVLLDGDWLVAEGTTLGADNGIAVATMMAVAEDQAAQHGPLDLLMTIDEETGMTGAMGLDPGLLKGRIMLNLDSEDEGVLFVGCAGGCDVKYTFRAPRAPLPSGFVPCEVVITGLKGGHSGLEINKNRMNAIRALCRMLAAAPGPFVLASLDGGNKRNAIPRDARAVVGVAGGELQAFQAAVNGVAEELRAQFKGLDDGLKVTVGAPANPPADAFGAADALRLLNLLLSVPSGVVAMSQDIPGLVETSTNLGVVTTKGAAVEVANLARSSSGQALRDVVATLVAAGKLGGVQVEDLGGYPGWKPDMQSQALAVTRGTFRKLYGKEAEVTAIHAGLECGLIGDRVPGMDMVSLGPDIRGVHAPGEKVNVPSTGRFYQLLTAVLDDLSA